MTELSYPLLQSVFIPMKRPDGNDHKVVCCLRCVAMVTQCSLSSSFLFPFPNLRYVLLHKNKYFTNDGIVSLGVSIYLLVFLTMRKPVISAFGAFDGKAFTGNRFQRSVLTC